MLTNPSDDDLRAMRHGDAFHGTVGCTKTDQFGEIHAPFGYVLPFREGEPNAARGLRDLLLEERRGGDVPLFSNIIYYRCFRGAKIFEISIHGVFKEPPPHSTCATLQKTNPPPYGDGP